MANWEQSSESDTRLRSPLREFRSNIEERVNGDTVRPTNHSDRLAPIIEVLIQRYDLGPGARSPEGATPAQTIAEFRDQIRSINVAELPDDVLSTLGPVDEALLEVDWNTAKRHAEQLAKHFHTVGRLPLLEVETNGQGLRWFHGPLRLYKRLQSGTRPDTIPEAVVRHLKYGYRDLQTNAERPIEDDFDSQCAGFDAFLHARVSRHIEFDTPVYRMNVQSDAVCPEFDVTLFANDWTVDPNSNEYYFQETFEDTSKQIFREMSYDPTLIDADADRAFKPLKWSRDAIEVKQKPELTRACDSCRVVADQLNLDPEVCAHFEAISNKETDDKYQ